jgi:IclR family transcriptional regulator, acetate operon repressor
MTRVKKSPEQPRPRVAAMNRGFDVLELVVNSDQVRLAEVAKALGISRATAFRALTALGRRGYIEHVPSEQIYRLGTAFIALAARSASSSIVRLAAPMMGSLRNETRETVNLALIAGGRLVYVSIFDAPQGLRNAPAIGSYAVWHATALGKAVLMKLDTDHRDVLLGQEPYPQFTENTITSRNELIKELSASMRKGYAVDAGEEEVGGMCVAVPLTDAADYPIGALSVAGPNVRIRRLGEAWLGQRLRECSDEIMSRVHGARDGAARPQRRRTSSR